MAGLALSTFYYQRKAIAVPDKYASLKKRIRRVYARHKGRYGYRRVTDALRKLGETINYKTVQKLMQFMGLKSLVRLKKYRSFKTGDLSPAAPNILERQFDAGKLNQKWLTDVTEFHVGGERLYLSPVMDLCNGEIIAYEMARRPVLSMVTTMLRKALRKLPKTANPILHSDQGWHYRMPLYKELLDKRGVTQSMSRKGNCHDNAPMESFFAVLKTEYFHLNKFTTVEQLQRGLKSYIKYYNNERIKPRLGALSPVEYRTQLLMT
jgi:putative transposase